MLFLPYFIIVAGTGRNTGKTILAGMLIEKFSAQNEITGLKISPHFHTKTPLLNKISGSDQFNLYLETSVETEKDSSKMLKSGAHKVYYVETTDSGLPEALECFLKQIGPDTPVIAESPVLRRLVKPGIFIIVDNDLNKNKKEELLKQKQDADIFINTSEENLHTIVSKINLSKSGWELSNGL